MTTTIIIILSVALFCVVRVYYLERRENYHLRVRNAELSKMETIATCINNNCRYSIEPTAFGHLVLKSHEIYPNIKVIVKQFCDEDRDYSRRCAEELCDKLNETI